MPEQLENKMVVDAAWRNAEPVELPETQAGYHRWGSAEYVPENEAYEYALDHCLNGSEEEVKEFKEMLVDWFYSGGEWRRENA